MKMTDSGLPSRRTAYQYHIDNVRSDPDFQVELKALQDKVKNTAEYLLHYFTVDELNKHNYPKEAQLLKDFLEKWDIDDFSLKWRIIPKDGYQLEINLLYYAIRESPNSGTIMLEFDDDINKEEYKWIWRIVKHEQAMRGIKPVRVNRVRPENAYIAYVIWKKKRDGERINWREMVREYDKISSTPVNAENLKAIYKSYYKR